MNKKTNDLLFSLLRKAEVYLQKDVIEKQSLLNGLNNVLKNFNLTDSGTEKKEEFVIINDKAGKTAVSHYFVDNFSDNKNNNVETQNHPVTLESVFSDTKYNYAEVEKALIVSAILHNNKSRKNAAKQLGMSERTLYI